MEHEYRYAKGLRIPLWIFLPLFMIGFGYLGTLPYIENYDIAAKITLTAVSLIFECLIMLGLFDLHKYKLIVKDNTISSIGVFRTRTLKLAEIKGFKKNEQYLHFIPLDKKLKKIQVSSYVKGYRNLIMWAVKKLNDLDLQEIREEEEKILTNEDFGNTVEAREKLLKKAKKVTRIINTISWICAFSLLLLPHFYNAQVMVCAALPIIGLIIYKQFKGIIRFDEKPHSTYPSLLSTFSIPAGILTLRAITDYNIFDYENIWKPLALIFASLAFLIIRNPYINYNFKKMMTYFSILGMLMIGGMYAYGFIITTNAILDPSQREYFKAKVLDKRVASGKSTTYYFKLSEWGPQKEVEEVHVSRSLYNEKETDDSALIYYRQGFYKIPYYIVVE